MKNLMIAGETVTLTKMKSPFGPYYTVHKGQKLLGAIEGINDPSFGKIWHSLLLSPNNREFKMPASKRTWREAVEQLLDVEWSGTSFSFIANI